MIQKRLRNISMLFVWLIGCTANAELFNSDDDDFLPVEMAFKLSIEQSSAGNNKISLNWDIAEGYYLYQKQFKFKLIDANSQKPVDGLNPVKLPAGTLKNDDFFGEVMTYRDAVSIDLEVNTEITAPVTLLITSQGCADAGLCYSPQQEAFNLITPIVTTPATSTIVTNDKEQAPESLTPESQGNSSFSLFSNSNSLTDLLDSDNLLLIIPAFFIAGLLLSFTPCVLPMIPILSSIVVSSSTSNNAKDGFILSLAYVAGMSLTYTTLGMAAGYFGAAANLQIYLQRPEVIIFVAVLFALLALSMFGHYNIQLPAFIQEKLDNSHQRGKGGLIGVAIMGAVTALIVSPCISAPLIGALIFISKTGDVALGGLALFSVSIGMSMPLLAIGSGAGKYVPKSGPWMEAVKTFFGYLLLAVAIYLVARVASNFIHLSLWAVFCAGITWHLGLFSHFEKPLPVWRKMLAIVIFSYGILLAVGAFTGADNPLQPVKKAPAAIKPSGYFSVVTQLSSLENILLTAKQNQSPVIIDFYADWCISCIVIDKKIFSQQEVINELQPWTTIKVDLSNISGETTAIMEAHQLLGLPSILFIAPDGSENPKHRIQGELTIKEFKNHLNSLPFSPNKEASTL